MSVEIELTLPELSFAASVGMMRQLTNIKRGRQHRHGYTGGESWNLHIEGAAAEMALAKHLGVYWSGAINDIDATDAGGYQVRSTHHAGGCLILHDDDADKEIFVLAIGPAPRIRLAGWIAGYNGKQRNYWRDPVGNRPAYFVPQSHLRPMEAFAHAKYLISRDAAAS